MMNTTCPCCPKQCPLSAPQCGRGARYAKEVAGENPTNEMSPVNYGEKGHRHGGHHKGGRRYGGRS